MLPRVQSTEAFHLLRLITDICHKVSNAIGTGAREELTLLLPIDPGDILALRVEIQWYLCTHMPQQGDLVERDLCRFEGP